MTDRWWESRTGIRHRPRERGATDRGLGERTAERGLHLGRVRRVGAGRAAGPHLGLHRHGEARARGGRRHAAGVRRPAADHGARARRRGSCLPQRVQPPRHDVDGRSHADARHHPLPLPLMDLRPGRLAALHADDRRHRQPHLRRLRAREAWPEAGADRHVVRRRVRQPERRCAALRDIHRAGGQALEGFRRRGPALRGERLLIHPGCRLQLEARGGELLRGLSPALDPPQPQQLLAGWRTTTRSRRRRTATPARAAPPTGRSSWKTATACRPCRACPNAGTARRNMSRCFRLRCWAFTPIIASSAR